MALTKASRTTDQIWCLQNFLVHPNSYFMSVLPFLLVKIGLLQMLGAMLLSALDIFSVF